MTYQALYAQNQRSHYYCAGNVAREDAVQSTMQDVPLTVTRILVHGVLVHGTSRITTWTGEGEPQRRSFAEAGIRAVQLANALRDDLAVQGGDRVATLMWNNAEHVEAYFAIPSMGAVLHTLNLRLPAEQLVWIVNHAADKVVIVNGSLLPLLAPLLPKLPTVEHVVVSGPGDRSLLDGARARVHDYEELIAGRPTTFDWPDIDERQAAAMCYTSGTTGVPKGAMHFHREMIATCETFARHVLEPRADDRFIGSPPLAFTFGFGGHALFPLWAGASTVLIERAGPDDLLTAIPKYGATTLFTAPTAYRVLLSKMPPGGLPTLRLCVSAGETLPAATFEAWRKATGISILDGLGSTEMLHIFVAARPSEMRAGATGKAVPGYEAKIIDENGADVADGTPGRLAVRGPTGCKYLADPRQTNYVQNGWNVTGDTYVRDADGYFHYQARSDDMIVSAGYNIGGPEVEAALLLHEAVAECAVIGWPDAARGMIVKAFVVLRQGFAGDAAMVEALQNHAKATIAPYKYPRAVEFREALPKTPTGKLQRFKLREGA